MESGLSKCQPAPMDTRLSGPTVESVVVEFIAAAGGGAAGWRRVECDATRECGKEPRVTLNSRKLVRNPTVTCAPISAQADDELTIPT
jgi:hypothetical protein